MVVHSSSGVTGALFFAAAPLITQQDEALESEAQLLLESVVRQFAATQLPVLEAIPIEHLMRAKDGGRVSSAVKLKISPLCMQQILSTGRRSSVIFWRL